MIRLLTAVLLFASFNTVAEVTLTDINNNEVADAEDVMGNFNALKEGVEANTASAQANATAISANGTAIDALPLPPSDCTADQIIKWDDTNGVWVCADMPSVNVSEPANRYKWEYVGWSGSSQFPLLTDGTFKAFGSPLDMVLQLSMNGQSGESVLAPIQHMDTKLSSDVSLCFMVLSPASASNGLIEVEVDEVRAVDGIGSPYGWAIGVGGGLNARAYTNLVVGETYSLEFLDC